MHSVKIRDPWGEGTHEIQHGPVSTSCGDADPNALMHLIERAIAETHGREAKIFLSRCPWNQSCGTGNPALYRVEALIGGESLFSTPPSTGLSAPLRDAAVLLACWDSKPRGASCARLATLYSLASAGERQAQ